MASTLPIGDFSRATHLSVKQLRHYHEIGLLEPVDVDEDTGYRRYATEQIVTAQIVRRFRELDMPLEDIQIVLQAPDVETRNRVIANHLRRLESSLARTQDAVSSLRELLDHPQASVPIDHRQLAATPAAVISDIVDKADALAWYRGAIAELAATLSAQEINPAGPAGGIFDTELFTEDRSPHRHRSNLRCPRRLRDPACARSRWADSRVLRHRPLRNPRRLLVANRSWMADLPNPSGEDEVTNSTRTLRGHTAAERWWPP
jgi:DNA-binding transcriptional MerR regulator